MVRKLLIFTFFFISSLILTSVSFGQVQTRLRIIEASNIGIGIDPPLRDIHNQLGSLFNFTSYRLIGDNTFTLVPNQPVSISVPQGRSVEINLLGTSRGIIELRLRILSQRSEILNTQLRLSPNRTVIIGGPRLEKGVAIFAISANF